MTLWKTALAGVLAAAGAQAAAQQAGAPEHTSAIETALACRSIEADQARLACQDAALAALAEAVEAGRVSVAAEEPRSSDGGGAAAALAGLGGLFTRDRDEDAPSQAREEALEDGSVAVYGRDGQIEEVRGLPVDRVTEGRFGKLTVYLENGQVWRQTDTYRISAPDEDELNGLTAEVDSGLFGSHFMELSHNPRRFRAERVR